ncbi:unnamed protein product [Medioppia subpectinata]|uniref:ENT domain-containing protein n=1 Tax=Medioppia subpectinata TaxID=1979941 RepID=A0A7R9KQM2_9ACAR|nr:unnamed protein product [Medioppia subpectinata]CAG2106876.1 unnamed protein product [Medioppia subpectinata]
MADRDECKRSLRRYELEAYSSVVTALRAQGDLNKDKRKILQDLCSIIVTQLVLNFLFGVYYANQQITGINEYRGKVANN